MQKASGIRLIFLRIAIIVSIMSMIFLIGFLGINCALLLVLFINQLSSVRERIMAPIRAMAIDG
ncbi:MAG: hypothetical protein ACO20L_00360, partial [Candidatus Puniceispirillaceae bacterium]